MKTSFILLIAALAVFSTGNAEVVNHVKTATLADDAVQLVSMAERYAEVKEVSLVSKEVEKKAHLKNVSTSLPIAYYERPKGTTYVGMSPESASLNNDWMYFPAFKEVDWTNLAFGAESFKWAYASGELDSEDNDVMNEATTNVITTPKYDGGYYTAPQLTATNSVGDSIFSTVDFLYTAPVFQIEDETTTYNFLSTNIRPDAEIIAAAGATIFNSDDANKLLDQKFGLSAAGFTDVKLDGISELYYKPLRPYLLSQVVAHVADINNGAANINAQLVINRVELDENDDVKKIGEKLCEATIECAVVAGRQWQILNFENLVYTDPETGRKKDLIIDDNILVTIRPTDGSQFAQYLWASSKAWLQADPSNRWNLSTAYALISAQKDGNSYLIPGAMCAAYYMDDANTIAGAMKSWPIQILAETYYIYSADKLFKAANGKSSKAFKVNSYYSYDSGLWNVKAVDADGNDVDWIGWSVKDNNVVYDAGSSYYSGISDLTITASALPVDKQWREAWLSIGYYGAEEKIHIVQGDNNGNDLYVSNAEVCAGKSIKLSLNMNNYIEVVGFQCDFYAPQNTEVAVDSIGEYAIELSEARTNAKRTNTFDFERMEDGAIRIIACSTMNYPFSGQLGEVATIVLNTSENLEAGDYPLLLKNIVITDALGSSYEQKDVETKLTVKKYEIGDANGDGEVNIGDYTTITNYILNRNPAQFVEIAADTNGDGNIDVADLARLVGILLKE